MKIKIMNYAGQIAEIQLKDFENVVKMKVEIFTGDEILYVLFKDYTEKVYDSAVLLNNPRIMNFHDGGYIVYDKTKNINYLDKWNKRTSTIDIEDLLEE